MEDIRDEDEAEEEKGLVEVGVRLFITTTEHQGIMCMSVRIRHTRDANITASFTTI